MDDKRRAIGILWKMDKGKKIQIHYTNINGKNLHFVAVNNLDAECFARNRSGIEHMPHFLLSTRLYISEQVIDDIIDKSYIEIARKGDKGYSAFLFGSLLFKTENPDNLDSFLIVMMNEFTMKSIASRKDYGFVDDDYNLFQGMWWTRESLIELGERIDARDGREPIYFGPEESFRKRILFPLRYYFDRTCFHDLKWIGGLDDNF